MEHCQRRIKELSIYHDMDMSKFIRWLIRNDSQDQVSIVQDKVMHCHTTPEPKKNIPSFNVIQPAESAPEQQKNQPDKLVWRL